MKVLTLFQPWATLVILGEKKIETRSWKTNYRGEIAIHAGKKVDKSVFKEPYYTDIFEKYNLTPDNIIKSSIIGTCSVLDVKRTEELVCIVSERERTFGNYCPNRYGWILGNVKPIEPIRNVKGMLGIWSFDIT